MVSPRPRPSRVSFDRSSRDGDGQTIGSRLVNGGTVRRRAPLAVTPGRLNRSPIRVSKTRRLARGTRQWRLGAAVTVPARRLRRMSAAKRLFSGRPEKGPAVHVRALVRSCPTAHAPRVPSRDARTMRRPRRSPSAYPRTCCGSSRCVSRSSAAGVRRLPAIPKRAFLFRGRRQRVVVTHARIAPVRPRGVPSRIARTSSHSQTLFSPPRSRAFPTRALPRNRVVTPDVVMDDASSAQKGTVAWISHLGARAPRLSGFLLARGFPGNAPAEGLTQFLRANVPAAIGFVAPHSLLPPRRMHGLCKRLATDAERVWFGSFAAFFFETTGIGAFAV